MSEEAVLPNIVIENSPPLYNVASIPEYVTPILEDGGFKVLQVKQMTARMMPGTVEVLLYKVRLPSGWRMRVHERRETFLVDGKGYWRGRVDKTAYDDPVRTTLFCRYSELNDMPHPNWYKGLPKPNAGMALRVVADRTKIDKNNPLLIHGGVVWQEEYPARGIDDLTPEEIRNLKNDMERALSEWPPEREPYPWLQENFPDWQNPFAYW